MSRVTTRPSLGASLKKLALPIVVVAITAGATNAFGGSPKLIAIPTLEGDIANIGRGITPDGLWVVGDSYWSAYRGFLYDVAGSNVYNVLATGQSSTASGVCYRESGGQQQIIVGGLAAGWNADYCFTNGSPSGAFIGSCRRDFYDTGDNHPKPVTGIANTRTSGGGDVFWGAWTEVAALNGLFAAVSRVSGDWQGQSTTVTNDYDTSTGAKSAIYGVSGTGRAVGVISGLNGCVWDWTGSGTPTVWQFNGMDGTLSEVPFAISADGTIIFGRSYSSDPINRPHLWPYKATFDTNMPGPATQLSINELPGFPDTVPSAGTPGSAGLPYGCTADGKCAVGYSYRGFETAVLWDTSNPDPAKWTVLDLMQFATAQGIAGSFMSLDRAYSIGVTAAGDLAITGYGIIDYEQHAFLLTIPRPLSAYSVYPPTLSISNNLSGYTFRFNSILTSPSTLTPLTNYLEYTTVLSNPPTPSTWTTLIATQCNGGLTTVVDPNPTDAQRFYRIRTQ